MSSDLTPAQLAALARESRKRPRTPGPAGGVTPPKPRKHPVSGREAKLQARRIVEKVCLGGQWMVAGFRVRADGEIEMALETHQFPGGAIETAAELFANALVKEALRLGVALAPGTVAPDAAQNSEPAAPAVESNPV